MKNQDRTPLLEAIEDFIETKPAYFRIPGHRLDRGISTRWTDKVGTKIFAYDVTETPLTDDLHAPEGAILEAQDLLSELYKSDKSYFLVNGTTCGNEAMIISTAFEGEKIMIARNAHKSAMMGLILSGAQPVYVMPEILDEWGIQGGITPQNVRDAFEKNPDCKALFLVSPSYYGIVSDLEGIAKVCHEYGALLLVDEAHGGHVYFHKDLPKGAIESGADMCVQSFHKITGALTQSSVMHIKNNGVSFDEEKISANLHLVQSTSPNYLLMTSLDCARYELAIKGDEMMEKAIALADYAKSKLNDIDGICYMDDSVVGSAGVAGIDTTRLVISVKGLGLSGFEFEEMLYNEYDVNMELADYENVLAIITYANTQEDIDRLIDACRDISNRYMIKSKKSDVSVINTKLPDIPKQVMTPRKAHFANVTEIDWQQAVGNISAQILAPYPPGIPIIYPGEIITKEVWEYIERFRKDGRHIHGAKAGKLDTVSVIKYE